MEGYRHHDADWTFAFAWPADIGFRALHGRSAADLGAGGAVPGLIAHHDGKNAELVTV
jgi:hypothetical protein